MGRAAVALGSWHDAFRPRTAFAPLDRRNLFLRLRAAFVPLDGSFAHPVAYGVAVWQGLFDAAYTRPGDYLKDADGAVWFIAAQQHLLPTLCVRASRRIALARPGAADVAGVNAYGGVVKTRTTAIASGIPAAMLESQAARLDASEIPAGVPSGLWTALLPALPGLALAGGELLTDDLGRTGTVVNAELSDLGWRLVVKQAVA